MTIYHYQKAASSVFCPAIHRDKLQPAPNFFF